MLVDVVLMRSGGVKLPQEQVAASEGTRGRLVIQIERGAETTSGLEAPGAPVARLYDPDDEEPGADQIMVLFEARVTSLKGADFVLVGQAQGEPQAWWCRLAEAQPPRRGPIR